MFWITVPVTILGYPEVNRTREILYTAPMGPTPTLAKTSIQETKLSLHQSDASVHLDAVRGLAALAVFLGHGRPMFLKSRIRDLVGVGQPDPVAASAASPGPKPAAPHETVGHEAVIIFFVLSGYFVGGSALRAMRKGVFSWKTYLFQRFTRLWIVLLPALLLGWALDAGGMRFLPGEHNIYSGPAGQEEVSPDLASRLTPTVFAGNLFFLQTVFFREFGTNASLWSLSYEFWYYIFFPFLATIFIPGKGMVQRVISVVVLVTLFVIFGTELSRYFIIWLFGVVVSMVPLTLPEGRRRLATVAACAAMVLAMVGILRVHLSLYLSDLILSTVFFVFLWTILHSKRATVNATYRWLAQGLSKMSYTLYAVHLPFLAVVSAILMPEWHAWTLSLRSVTMLLGVYAVVFAASWLMYFTFERNTDSIRKKLSMFG